MFTKRFITNFGALTALLAAGLPARSQSNASRGLWVGEVTLNSVNEASVPLDENNVPKAQDPNVPTKTFDTANLRLILHVDGTGHVSLLKDVAVLSRTGETLPAVSDMALVTDPHLYGEFPPQAAIRIASAVFDFGDSKATEALNKVVSAASISARNAVVAGTGSATAISQATAAANAIVTQANVAQRFSTFLSGPGKSANVKDIADGTPANAAGTMMTEALALQNNSFYGDTRGVEMVNAVQAAVNAETLLADKTKAALNTAASFADLANNYERFLAGQLFGNMIHAAAEATAAASAAAPQKTITNFSGTDGSFPVTVTCANHGLATGDEIAITGSPVTSYNGLWTVTRVDADAFLIQTRFVGARPSLLTSPTPMSHP